MLQPFQVRLAAASDVEAVLGLFDQARAIMRSDGNLTQWAGGYPDAPAVLRDIDAGVGYVLVRSSADPVAISASADPVAYFALIPSPDPTYSYIEGAWLDDEPYGVIHRIASGPENHGIMASILDFAFSKFAEIRIDTHENNHIMRHILERSGFVYCGVIYVADGSPRMAYQRR